MTLRDQKGQVMIELALVLPLLMLLIFGITELGRAICIVNTLTNAAREGARRASVSSTPLNLEQLRTYVKGCIPFDQTGILIDITPAAPTHGVDTVKVAVNLPFKSTVPVMDMIDGITLKGEAAMFYE